MSQQIELNIDLVASYDDSRSLSIHEAAAMMRGQCEGGRACPEVVARYANPRRGYRPHGPEGPVLVLPAIRLGGRRGQLRTMPEWVKAFERERVRLGVELARREQGEKPRPKRSFEGAQRRAGKVLDAAGVG